MFATDPTVIRELGDHDIRSILGRNTIGRLAFVRGDAIDILPIQYVYHEGTIYGRTAADGKLRAMGGAETVVAFEVDEIESAYNWRSVLAHGTFSVIEQDTNHEEWLNALGIVRRLHHTAFRRGDNQPDRSEIFRIPIRRATGRALG